MQTDAQNPGCSRNGTDLQDPIRNRDVAQVRQWNESEKSSGGKRATVESDVIPAARPDTDYRRKSHITTDWS